MAYIVFMGSALCAAIDERGNEMQLTEAPKKVKHNSFCEFYGKTPAKGCWKCAQLTRPRNPAHYTANVSDDLRGEH